MKFVPVIERSKTKVRETSDVVAVEELQMGRGKVI